MDLETFTRSTDDLPRITSLEPGWELLEPDEDLPIALVVHVPLKGDSESGIPETDEQHDAMTAVAESLAKSLSRQLDARFIAVDTCDSMHAFHFRIPKGKAPGPAIAEALKKTGSKAERVECYEDEEWDTVFDGVLPDPYEVATSDALMLIWTLEDEGANLASPRPVRHTILLPDATGYEAFGAWAESRGYKVTKGEAIDEIGFHVHATRTEAVDPDAALDEVEAVVEETLRHDGTYVEWDCTGDDHRD